MTQRKAATVRLTAVAAAISAGLHAPTALAQDRPEVAATLPPVTVTRTLPDALDGVPGSSTVLRAARLEAERPYTLREAMQGAPGVHVVGEDAFGLNLNIGIRGLDPRRSSRTLLLEDGMPIQLAPYSDPTTHYHTPLERISRIEVIKGSGQIVHGPQTVGGVINFVTRPVPRQFGGEAEVAAGTRGFAKLGVGVGSGGAWGGWRLDAAQRQGDGTRDGSRHRTRDLGAKAEWDLSPQHALTLKLNRFEERSNFGEAGLDQARFDANPYGNAFRNDRFALDRDALQLVHQWTLTPRASLSTQVYWSRTQRASYRQLDAISEFEFDPDEELPFQLENEELRSDDVGADGQGTVDACPGYDYTEPNGFETAAALCGNQMRPRTYKVLGIEPRLQWQHEAFGLKHELTAGVRLHREDIVRRRYNGAFPTARENSPGTGLRDRFEIETDAVAAYVQNTVHLGDWAFTPGLRYERYEQRNRITQEDFAPADGRISSRTSELLPGLGATWNGLAGTTVFAGVHRGLAPPRPDANLLPNDPELEPVEPELSTNLELGLRSLLRPGLQVEATLFRIDFRRQIVPGYAVGAGQTFVNGGRSTHRGVELAGRADFARLNGSSGPNPYLTASYTHLATAKVRGDLLVPFFAEGEDETDVLVNARGNRLPYAPRHLLSASVGVEHPAGWNARLGLTHVSRQFSDALNTVAPAANGQSGVIPSYTLLNAAVNVKLPRQGLTVYLAGTNLADKRYLVSRVNGAFAGARRQVQLGATLAF